ncbi:MAG TPA: S9 family peptidase [Bacteroidales bacterium]|nr:S9 family peptidase [Bacteroidales bacterium]HOH83033.1 S9 family peptidase [Bacteroidales bacterium]HPB26180.1 S9 family peptidase [Bacteroidales bacterium]HPI30418.1 S9 family peptidase [Bacteroidales bacterium]HQN16944.1 S9 family peptidase [Bacteroidales bacterium]
MKKTLVSFLLAVAFIPALFAQGRLTPELLWKFGRVSDIKLSPDKKSILYGVTFYNLEQNKGNRDLYLVPLAGGAAVNITNSPGSEWNGVWRPDGKKIGYISAEYGTPQLWEMNPDGTSKKQITSFEGGITGFAYAPDMKHILFTRDIKLDKTVTEVYPDLPQADARIIDDLFYRHWNDWHDYAYSHIIVSAYADGTVTGGTDILGTEKFDAPLTPDGGMEQIAWSPDGQKVAYVCRKLHGKDEALSTNSDIYLYHLQSGLTENISKDMGGYDLDPVFSPDGKKIAWCSMKTPGYESDKKRLIIYDFSAKTIADMSANFDESASTLNWSADAKSIYFLSYTKGTCQVFQCDMATGKINQLTEGVHDFSELSADGKNTVAVKMSMSMPSEIYRIDNEKGKYKPVQLTFTNKELLSSITMGNVEERWVTTSDNKKMLVWVIYPPNFDKNKKYPALLYCQGGPQSTVSQFFSYRWNFQMMAANDYIVVAPNRRGLPGFGKEWNDQIALDYGGQNMLDYLTAIDSVAKEPFVNKDKLGAVGASYGGFSVYWLAGNHNKRFKAFIAHCGMFNFESWYGTTEEMWFPNHDFGGAYWEHPKPQSYDFSPHKFVGNWDTPILVIHGGYDFRIPYTEGMQAFNVAQLQGIPSRFLYFPNETHFVTKPQNSVLWQREFFGWLDQWLK